MGKEQAWHKIVQGGDGLSGGANCQAASIFMEGHIPTIVEFSFNGPMGTMQVE